MDAYRMPSWSAGSVHPSSAHHGQQDPALPELLCRFEERFVVRTMALRNHQIADRRLGVRLHPGSSCYAGSLLTEWAATLSGEFPHLRDYAQLARKASSHPSCSASGHDGRM